MRALQQIGTSVWPKKVWPMSSRYPDTEHAVLCPGRGGIAPAPYLAAEAHVNDQMQQLLMRSA